MIWIWFNHNKLRYHSPPLQKYKQRQHTSDQYYQWTDDDVETCGGWDNIRILIIKRQRWVMIWIWFDCNKLRCHSPPLQKYQQRPHTLTNTISKWMTMTIYLQGVISSCLEYGLRVEAKRGVGFGEYLPIDIKNEWQIISTHLFLVAKETMRMSGLMCWRWG